jgi:hypothetical protein
MNIEEFIPLIKIGLDFPLKGENRDNFPTLGFILVNFWDRLFKEIKFCPTEKQRIV